MAEITFKKFLIMKAAALTESGKAVEVAEKWFTTNHSGGKADFELPLTKRKDGDDTLVATTVTSDDWNTSKTVVIRVNSSGEVSKSSVAEWKAVGGYWNPRG